MAIPCKPLTIFDRLRLGERLPSSIQTYFAPANEVITSPAGSDNARSVKVHIKALGKGVIQHPILGPVVHDFSTVRIPKRLAIDDTHGAEVGKATPSITEYGLEADGFVVPKTDRDSAGNLVEDKDHPSSRIAYNLREDFPQAASADWRGPFDVELIPEGATMQVNGLDVTGPCLKIMNWGVRSLAICKVGVDPSALSEAQLNSAGQELAPAPGKVTIAGESKTIPAPPVVPVGTLPVAAQLNAVNHEGTTTMTDEANKQQNEEYAALQAKHAQELCQLNAEHATARAAAPADKIGEVIAGHSTQLNEMYARHGQEVAEHVKKFTTAGTQELSAPPAAVVPAAAAPVVPAASAPATVKEGDQTHALPPKKNQELALAGEAKVSVVSACNEAAAACAALATAIRAVNPEVADDATEAADSFKTAGAAVAGDQTNDGEETWEAFHAARCLLNDIAAIDTAEAKAAIVSLTKAVTLLSENYGGSICCYSVTHQFMPKSKTPATIVAPVVTGKPAVETAAPAAAVKAGKIDPSAQLNSAGKVEGAAPVVPVDAAPAKTTEPKPEPQATDLPPDLAKQYADLGLDPKAGVIAVLQQYAAVQKTNADLQERVKKLAGGAAPVEATPVKPDPQLLSWPALVNGIIQEYAEKGQVIEVQQAHAIACERYKDANAKLRIPLKQK